MKGLFPPQFGSHHSAFFAWAQIFTLRHSPCRCRARCAYPRSLHVPRPRVRAQSLVLPTYAFAPARASTLPTLMRFRQFLAALLSFSTRFGLSVCTAWSRPPNFSFVLGHPTLHLASRGRPHPSQTPYSSCSSDLCSPCLHACGLRNPIKPFPAPMCTQPPSYTRTLPPKLITPAILRGTRAAIRAAEHPWSRRQCVLYCCVSFQAWLWVSGVGAIRDMQPLCYAMVPSFGASGAACGCWVQGFFWALKAPWSIPAHTRLCLFGQSRCQLQPLPEREPPLAPRMRRAAAQLHAACAASTLVRSTAARPACCFGGWCESAT